MALDNYKVEWVATPQFNIRNATLNLVAKFIWLIMRNRLTLTQEDYLVIWDRAFMVADLVSGIEIKLPNFYLL